MNTRGPEHQHTLIYKQTGSYHTLHQGTHAENCFVSQFFISSSLCVCFILTQRSCVFFLFLFLPDIILALNRTEVTSVHRSNVLFLEIAECWLGNWVATFPWLSFVRLQVTPCPFYKSTGQFSVFQLYTACVQFLKGIFMVNRWMTVVRFFWAERWFLCICWCTNLNFDIFMQQRLES